LIVGFSADRGRSFLVDRQPRYAAAADLNEENVLICNPDLDNLPAARRAGTVSPWLDRRPNLFQFVSAFRASGSALASAEPEGPLGDLVSLRNEQAAKEK
jgi:hypothetical protein